MTTSHPKAEGGRVALVTGGTRGIGFGIAQALADEGFELALCGRRGAEQVNAALDELRGRGHAVHYFQCDIAEAAQRERLIDDVKCRCGRLHVL
ncbi:MAG: SDR family NAD(P)-dependent oxidoreductase, partial [Chitinivibrionales bacterium]|nr:SDR family NAD(P)-dependent oxidoreductase [Chitinivibrionales bacterium]